MIFIHHGEQAKCHRREVAQVVRRIRGSLPSRRIARIQEIIAQVDFVIPQGGNQSQGIVQVCRIARHVVRENEGGRNIQVRIRCTRFIRNIPTEARSEPRHQSTAACIRGITVSLAINPQTVECVPVPLEERNKHTITDTFRYRAATLVHIRARSFLNRAARRVESRPNNTRSTQTLRRIGTKDRRKFSTPSRVTSSFIFQRNVMESLPGIIQRCRISRIRRCRENTRRRRTSTTCRRSLGR